VNFHTDLVKQNINTEIFRTELQKENKNRVTHNSRYSQQIFDNNVKPDKVVWFNEEDEIIITKTLAKANLTTMGYIRNNRIKHTTPKNISPKNNLILLQTLKFDD